MKSYFLIFLLLLSSCGLKPAYRKYNNTTLNSLESIIIEPISTVEGAELYYHLTEILPKDDFKQKKYILTNSIEFYKDFNIIQKNSDILREVVTIKSNFELKEIQTNNVVTSGQIKRFSSFSTSFSPYSNILKHQNIRKNLAISCAEEIRSRLILFFEKQQNQ